MEKFEIEISLLKDGEVIAKRTCENWEVAEMNLESLKGWWQKEKPKKHYSIYLKSICDYPDWERECDASSKEEAMHIFLKSLNQGNPDPWDEDMIRDKILVEN